MRQTRHLAALAVVGLAVVVAAGFAVRGQEATRGLAVPLTSPYQAVLLSNNQAYFGKLEKEGTAFPVLTDVFYVQTRVNPETKEPINTLVKRGNEWHAPDRMILNAQHILFIEPVAPDSTLARLIKETKEKKAQEKDKDAKKSAAPEKAAGKSSPK